MKNLISLIVILSLLSCGKPFLKGEKHQMWIGNAYHKCRFPKCPYKGVGRSNEFQAIWDYIGTPSKYDAYRVDSAHFRKPYWGYEKIARKLF